jgi:FAD/FMN-containing dehydrogenase
MEAVDLARLRPQFRGELLGPADPGYDAACLIYNGMIEKRPALVARCLDAADVATALSLAREFGFEVSVRGGGHNIAGHALSDGGLTIDLSGLRAVEVDAEARLARAGGGATWNDVDAATVAHGLATPGGTFGTTGIGGLTLGGGIGHLLGPHGLTCDNLVSAEVVTADGRVVVAGEHDPELLWGLRGGGGNFGVVTSFTYRLHSVARLWGGIVAYGPDHARTLLRVLRDMLETLPDEFTPFLIMSHHPVSGAPVLVVSVCHVGEAADGERVAKPLRAIPSLEDRLGPIGYAELQAVFGEGVFALRRYWKGHFVRALADELVDAIVELYLRPGAGEILLEPMLAGARRLGDGDSAFANRGAAFNVTAMQTWADEAEDATRIAWVREMVAVLEPYSFRGGGYLNYMGADEPIERVRAAYGDEAFAALRALKRRYDPENVFRLNQNVPPQ